MVAAVLSGERQRQVPPAASTLSIALKQSDVPPARTQDIVFLAGVSAPAAAAFDPNALAVDLAMPIYLSTGIVGVNGFGKLTIDDENGDFCPSLSSSKLPNEEIGRTISVCGSGALLVRRPDDFAAAIVSVACRHTYLCPDIAMTPLRC